MVFSGSSDVLSFCDADANDSRAVGSGGSPSRPSHPEKEKEKEKQLYEGDCSASDIPGVWRQLQAPHVRAKTLQKKPLWPGTARGGGCYFVYLKQ